MSRDLLAVLLVLIPYVLSEKLEIRMPDVKTTTHDSYLVRPFKITEDEIYIIGFEAVASSDKVHHLLLYGCTEIAQDKEYWSEFEGMGGICRYDSKITTILWAWALDAPKFELPDGIGFKVGKEAKINYIAMQIHYKYVVSNPDSSGVNLVVTKEQPARLAGIYLFADGSTVIPPHSIVNADLSCEFKGKNTIEPFAFRTHTHTLGRRVSAWREREGRWELIGTGDPRKPQMFYLIEGEKTPISEGDLVHARCVFDSSDRDTRTIIGATGKDEMCNFYMMYSVNASLFSYNDDGCFRSKRFTVPRYARITDPLANRYEVSSNWSLSSAIGQVGGLSHNTQQDQLVVFHRGSNDWSSKQWFDQNNNVLFKKEFIKENTVLFVNPETGMIEESFGKDMFIMPHGVYLDSEDNVYLTDVALHQVVDIARNIYVSDGYCNSRVVKFDHTGKFLAQYGESGTEKGKPGIMGLVHDLTIDPIHHEIHVADRENGQVHVLNYLSGNFTRVYPIPGSVYSVDFSTDPPALFAVNVTDMNRESKIMTIDPATGTIKAASPSSPSPLKMPHSITHLKSFGLFAGEIAAPFKVWRFLQSSVVPPTPDTKDNSLTKTILRKISSTQIPISVVILLAIVGMFPVTYLAIVVVVRCRGGGQSRDGVDRSGFQKLLKDYDSSDDEDDLVFKKPGMRTGNEVLRGVSMLVIVRVFKLGESVSIMNQLHFRLMVQLLLVDF
eukprot:sb/3462501/